MQSSPLFNRTSLIVLITFSTSVAYASQKEESYSSDSSEAIQWAETIRRLESEDIDSDKIIQVIYEPTTMDNLPPNNDYGYISATDEEGDGGSEEDDDFYDNRVDEKISAVIINDQKVPFSLIPAIAHNWFRLKEDKTDHIYFEDIYLDTKPLVDNAYGFSIHQLLNWGICPETKDFDLALHKRRINNLTGIMTIPGIDNITDLDLSYNSIQDITPLIPLAPQLITLTLNDNKIHTIDVLRSFTNLKTLDLGTNKISTFAHLEGLIQLENLCLNKNPIDLPPLYSINLPTALLKAYGKYRDFDGSSFLHKAVKTGDPKNITLVNPYQIKHQLKDKDGNTAAHIAATQAGTNPLLYTQLYQLDPTGCVTLTNHQKKTADQIYFEQIAPATRALMVIKPAV